MKQRPSTSALGLKNEPTIRNILFIVLGFVAGYILFVAAALIPVGF